MRKVMTATAATIALASMQASAAEVKIDDLIVAKTISDAQRRPNSRRRRASTSSGTRATKACRKRCFHPTSPTTRSRPAVRRVRRARPSRRNIFAQRRRT